jgi:CheY-like chemotaxis protein
VAAARTAEEAEQAFAADPAELLLLDFHLDAGLTGLALRARLGPKARRLPCVIVTADHDPQIRAEVEAAGCLLLYKPLKPLALKSVMARLMAARTPTPQGAIAGASSSK